MTVELAPQVNGMTRQMNENVRALMFRLGWHMKDLAAAIGVSGTSVGRKIKGNTEWTLPEVEKVADVTYVSVAELVGTIPDYDEWLPRLDSNQQPAVYLTPQVTTLPGRHLALVS